MHHTDLPYCSYFLLPGPLPAITNGLNGPSLLIFWAARQSVLGQGSAGEILNAHKQQKTSGFYPTSLKARQIHADKQKRLNDLGSIFAKSLPTMDKITFST
jgi:hypothetical protein